MRWVPGLLVLMLFCAGCGVSIDEQMSQASEALQAEDFARAKAIYSRVLDQHPHHTAAIEGMIAVTLSTPDEHTRWCHELLKYKPWDRHANLVVGLALAEEGDLDDAMNRLILAYMDSVFTIEKEQAIQAIERVRRLQSTPTAENQP